jgi:ribosomal protein L24E
MLLGIDELTVIVRLQGKLYVRGDSKIFRFQNGKSESLFLQRKNPRRIAWTVLFRRQHRKGISEVRSISRAIYGRILSSTRREL